MRRNEKEIKDRSIIDEILNGQLVGRLGLSLGDIPYVVPVNYVHKNDMIYFHSAKEGKKVEILSQNANVCFEVEEFLGLIQNEIPCGWGTKFRSVIAFGQAKQVTEIDEKKDALNLFMEKHGGSAENEFDHKMLESVQIFRIDCNQMTGKQGL